MSDIMYVKANTCDIMNVDQFVFLKLAISLKSLIIKANYIEATN